MPVPDRYNRVDPDAGTLVPIRGFPPPGWVSGESLILPDLIQRTA